MEHKTCYFGLPESQEKDVWVSKLNGLMDECHISRLQDELIAYMLWKYDSRKNSHPIRLWTL